jgi:Flp pilus assembly protein TadG
MMTVRKSAKGSALVEFTLAGIFLLFVWVSIAEMARGMWNYHTLQHAAKTAGAYASVHGATCSKGTNACTVSINNIATVFRNAAIGVPADRVSMTFTTESGAVTTCKLGGLTNPCSSQTSVWPPSANNDNQIGRTLTIRADYSFRSALAMFVPGHGAVRFGSISLPGQTTQIIQY